MDDMQAMKAIRCDRFGPPEVLKLEKTSIPESSGDEVLVRNYSTSVNTVDVLMRSGKPPAALSTTAKILLGPLIRLGMSGIRKPRQKIPGFGLCGEIVGIGDNVKDWEIGEKVYGYHKNTYAEYVTVPAKKLARKPDNLNFVEAGAVPGGASPAVGWFQVAKPEEGQNVLIIGASGGIGTFGVQIAKNCYNAIVTGVCGPTNLEMVKSIGADHVIDYTKEDYTSSDEKYDIIYDAIGVNTYSNCKKILAKDGIFLSNNPMNSMKHIPQLITSKFTKKKMKVGVTDEGSDTLDLLINWIEEGKVKPVIDNVYTLDQAADAHRHYETGHSKGRIVIKINEEA